MLTIMDIISISSPLLHEPMSHPLRAHHCLYGLITNQMHKLYVQVVCAICMMRQLYAPVV